MNEATGMLSLVLVILMAASSAVDIGSVEATPARIVPDGLLEIEKSLVNILGQSPDVLAFAGFNLRYGKIYQSPEEIKHRYSVFKENLDLIRSTNNKGLSYKLGVNQFADLTYQEFAAQYLISLPKHCYGPQLPIEVPQKNITNATWIDWRKSGFVSPVKNQGKCASSWVFSVTGALEAAYYRKYGTITLFSEQQILDCSNKYLECLSACRGGLPYDALSYVSSHALLSAAEYPYVARVGRCRADDSKPDIDVRYSSTSQRDPEDSLKQAVETVGPVSILLEVVNSFRFYKSGVYTTSDCGNLTEELNHAGLAVGYAIENGVPYWIIKNSWGEEWGDKGYFKIEMGKNMCGVASMGMYTFLG
ncbi:unnamed protein product [Eruca vesicaria subsp. sativa]|uniref:Cysteine protease n=1 Tax=Eruca vesicaria subsp. sativa TaxID=29727 RepID=A0ABC8JJC8_ERUVS|nr:unnamed protein product [Eruca vesicaria subsp. sativa]